MYSCSWSKFKTYAISWFTINTSPERFICWKFTYHYDCKYITEFRIMWTYIEYITICWSVRSAIIAITRINLVHAMSMYNVICCRCSMWLPDASRSIFLYESHSTCMMLVSCDVWPYHISYYYPVLKNWKNHLQQVPLVLQLLLLLIKHHLQVNLHTMHICHIVGKLEKL